VRCAQCGHEDPRAFEVRTASGVTAWFDSFECAIQRLAVACANCGTKVIGHGVATDDGLIYCCTRCAGVDLPAGTGLRQTSQPEGPGAASSPTDVDEAAAESFPASDAPAYWAREGAPPSD
jgi:hypothetical protein